MNQQSRKPQASEHCCTARDFIFQSTAILTLRRGINNRNFIMVMHAFILCFVFLPLDRIYECSVLCKCDKLMCQNRVVQHGVQVRLQVFNTEKKGWGVRCLDDIDKGTFVCTYSGSRTWSIILLLPWCVPWIFFENTGLEETCVNVIVTFNMIKWTEELRRALI